MKKAQKELQEFVIRKFKEDFPKEQRQKMDIEDVEIYSWLIQLQNEHFWIRGAAECDLPQMRHSLLEQCIGRYVF